MAGRQETGPRRRLGADKYTSEVALLIIHSSEGCLKSQAEAGSGEKGRKCCAGAWWRKKRAVSQQLLRNSEWRSLSAGSSFSTCHDNSGLWLVFAVLTHGDTESVGVPGFMHV